MTNTKRGIDNGKVNWHDGSNLEKHSTVRDLEEKPNPDRRVRFNDLLGVDLEEFDRQVAASIIRSYRANARLRRFLTSDTLDLPRGA